MLTADGVNRIRQDALTDPDDLWHFRHYQERISRYYGDDADLVLHVLDAYAAADEPLDVEGLTDRLGSVPPELIGRPTRAALVRLIDSLETDSYLTRRGNADQFAYRLLRDAWRSMRRLG